MKMYSEERVINKGNFEMSRIKCSMEGDNILELQKQVITLLEGREQSIRKEMLKRVRDKHEIKKDLESNKKLGTTHSNISLSSIIEMINVYKNIDKSKSEQRLEYLKELGREKYNCKSLSDFKNDQNKIMNFLIDIDTLILRAKEEQLIKNSIC